jgi:hypothetical protein
VRSLDFTINWNNLSNAFCHDNINGNNITSVVGNMSRPPELDFQYISRNDLLPVPDSIQYPLFVINRFPSPDQSVVANPLITNTIQSNNIQLHAIPKKIYIFARQTNANLDYTQTDSYANITNVSINWNNNSGQLSQASEQELYLISVRNGLKMSFSQWHTYCGSILCIDPSIDIALKSQEAPGSLLNFQFQLAVTLNNPGINTKVYTLYVVTVDEGVLSIMAGRAVQQIGVISSQDVMDSYSAGKVPYASTSHVYGGGFFDKLKSFLPSPETVWNAVKNAGLISKAANFIPGIGGLASTGLKAVGLGRMRGKPRKRRGGNIDEGKSEERDDHVCIEEEPLEYEDEEEEVEEYIPKKLSSKTKGMSALERRISRR